MRQLCPLIANDMEMTSMVSLEKDIFAKQMMEKVIN